MAHLYTICILQTCTIHHGGCRVFTLRGQLTWEISCDRFKCQGQSCVLSEGGSKIILKQYFGCLGTSNVGREERKGHQ